MKNIDNFPNLVPFMRSELHASEQENYEGEWLVNLPSGRTLEFDNFENANRVALNPPDDTI